MAERCKNGLKEVKVARPKPDAPVYRHFRPTEIRYEWLHISQVTALIYLGLKGCTMCTGWAIWLDSRFGRL